MRSSGMFVVYPSHSRGARQNLKFPENREFNREFSGFSTDSALRSADFHSHFNVLPSNSLSVQNRQIFSRFQCVAGQFPVLERTGNFFARTGNLFGGTGNSNTLSGFMETMYRTCPD
jgi:hypothetical protein